MSFERKRGSVAENWRASVLTLRRESRYQRFGSHFAVGDAVGDADAAVALAGEG